MNDRRCVTYLVFSMTLLACHSDSSEGSAPSTANSAATPTISAMPSAAAMPRDHAPRRGGLDGTLFSAARDLLSLTDEQRTKLDALEAPLRERDTTPHDAMNGFSSDLAAQIRAGKIDTAKMQADEAAIDAVMKTAMDKQATALGGLHDVLDTEQRKTVVDTIQAKSAAREAKMGEHDAGAVDWNARRLNRVTTDLGLDAAQQKLVAPLLAKQPSMQSMHDDMKKQMDGLLTAFQAEKFDAAKTLPESMKGKTPHDTMEMQIAFVAQLLAILHPDQREKLAASTEKPMMGRGDEDDRHGTHGGGP